MRAHREQFNRVLRFLARIQGEERNAVDYDDDLWSFFQNVWHLKDWVRNDPSIPKDVRDRVVDSAESSEVLQVCADLANRSKHFKLTNKRKDAEVTSRNTTVFPGQGRPSESTHIVTLDDGTQLVAQELAVSAFQAWEKIFLEEGLS